MDGRMRESLDRYITGNYGEDSVDSEWDYYWDETKRPMLVYEKTYGFPFINMDFDLYVHYERGGVFGREIDRDFERWKEYSVWWRRAFLGKA